MATPAKPKKPSSKTNKAASNTTSPETAAQPDRTIDTLIVTTPLNLAYNEKTFGVQFQDGQADISQHSKPNRYGYSLEDLARKFRNDVTGYQVKVIWSDGNESDGSDLPLPTTVRLEGIPAPAI